MKINLGCGQNKLDGYVNIDKHGDPDLRLDLEQFPWSIADNSVDEVHANHVLEHLGRDPDVFIGVMKELYRVCRPDAVVQINVPHPRHDHFIGDPTHVRIITPEVLSLFSRKNCARWAEIRAANSPLALYHDIDFEITETRMILDGRWSDMNKHGQITAIALDQAARDCNNVVKEIRITLRAIKPALLIQVPA